MATAFISTTTELILLNTSSRAGTILLPSTNIPGRILTFKDLAGTFGTSTITFSTAAATQNFETSTIRLTYNDPFGSYSFITGPDNVWYTIGGSRMNMATISSITTIGMNATNISSGNITTSTLQLRDINTQSTNTLFYLSTNLYYSSPINFFNVGPTKAPKSLYLSTRNPFNPSQVANLILWLDSSNVNTTSPTSGTLRRLNDNSGLANNATDISVPAPTVTNNGILYSASGPNFTRANLSATYTNTASLFIVASYNSNSGSPIFQPRLFMAGGATSVTEFRPLFIVLSAQNATPGISTYFNNLTPNINPTGQGGNLATYVQINYSSNFLFSLVGTQSGTTANVATFLNGNTQTFSAYNGSLSDSTRNSYFRYVLGGYLDGTTGVNQDAWNGNIYEVVLYSSALNTAQRQQVEGYLAWKWALQTNLPPSHPFRNAPP